MSTTELTTTKTDQVIAAGELIDQGTYGIYQVGQIRKSHTNRKKFNLQALDELAASISAKGVVQPILIRPVTPTADEPEEYELVAGERRWRASQIAGVSTIPAMCRKLSDLDAAEIQILENLQREDPHPLEEAEGYEQLMLKHGYNADQLADKIKKSRSYIYGRLKLCALTIDVREKFLNDELSASTALLIARIPVPALQVRALAEISQPLGWGPDSKSPMSYRSAVEHIQSRYTLDLGTAKFPIADAKLLATAGACSKCPKRTGNQPEIFPGVSADVCTDPDCFAEKHAAHDIRTIALANKKGIPVLEGAEGAAALKDMRNANPPLVTLAGPLWQFERNAPATKNHGRPEDLIPADALPNVASYVKRDDGTVVALYNKDEIQRALEKIGACETVEAHAARISAQAENPAGQATALAEKARQDELDASRQEAKAQTEFRVALYSEIRRSGPSIELVRAATKLALTRLSLPDDLLGEHYTFNADAESDVCAHIDHAPLADALMILIDMVFGDSLGVESWKLQNKSYRDDVADEQKMLTDLASSLGINPDQVRQSLIPEPPPVLPADAALDNTNFAALAQFVTENPDRINELSKAILSHPRGELIRMLERAAGACGYRYGVGGWSKDTPATPAAAEPADETDGDDLAGQLADVAPTPAPTAVPKQKSPAAPKQKAPAPAPAAAANKSKKKK